MYGTNRTFNVWDLARSSVGEINAGEIVEDETRVREDWHRALGDFYINGAKIDRERYSTIRPVLLEKMGGNNNSYNQKLIKFIAETFHQGGLWLIAPAVICSAIHREITIPQIGQTSDQEDPSYRCDIYMKSVDDRVEIEERFVLYEFRTAEQEPEKDPSGIVEFTTNFTLAVDENGDVVLRDFDLERKVINPGLCAKFDGQDGNNALSANLGFFTEENLFKTIWAMLQDLLKFIIEAFNTKSHQPPTCVPTA